MTPIAPRMWTTMPIQAEVLDVAIARARNLERVGAENLIQRSTVLSPQLTCPGRRGMLVVRHPFTLLCVRRTVGDPSSRWITRSKSKENRFADWIG